MIETLVTAAVICTNANWQHSERCTAPVAQFEVTDNGFYGWLESGVFFTQTHSGSTQTFRMEKVAWEVDGNGIRYIDV
jgi:hypothetical protein